MPQTNGRLIFGICNIIGHDNIKKGPLGGILKGRLLYHNIRFVVDENTVFKLSIKVKNKILFTIAAYTEQIKTRILLWENLIMNIHFYFFFIL